MFTPLLFRIVCAEPDQHLGQSYLKSSYVGIPSTKLKQMCGMDWLKKKPDLTFIFWFDSSNKSFFIATSVLLLQFEIFSVLGFSISVVRWHKPHLNVEWNYVTHPLYEKYTNVIANRSCTHIPTFHS